MVVKLRFLQTVCFLLLISTQIVIGQNLNREPDYSLKTKDTTKNILIKKRPVTAAVEAIGLNVGVWLFDRYILKGDYAYIGWNTMTNNLKTGFVWDNDSFSTNLLSHPYHGSLYFNSARSNGMNFWESFPYAVGGSLMWELFMENEPPSINDLFSTAVGGTALGEITFRLSSLVIDDSKRGFGRVTSELFGAVISPMRSFNRLMEGKLFYTSPYNSFADEHSPYSLTIGTGWRYLAKNNHLFQGDNGLFLDVGLEYGSPFDKDTYKPFDYFSLKTMINIAGNQPIVGSVNAIGILWGKTTEPEKDHDMTIGIFQHFDFYQTSELKKSTVVPFEIAQTAAIGGGLMYRFPEIGNKINMSYSVFANAVFMGGVLTDHFVVNDRNYNMGSGFSVKLQTLLEFKNIGSFFAGVEHYRLYTLKGYPNEPNPIPPDFDIHHLNAQGNKGFTYLTIINPRININLSPKFIMSFNPFIYIRNSNYEFFENVNYRTFETRISLLYKL